MYASFSAIALLLLLIAALGGYYFGYEAGESHAGKQYKKENERLFAKLQQATKIKERRSRKERLEAILKKHQTEIDASHEYEKKEPPKPYKRKPIVSVKRAKLAIIIDDISFAHDVQLVKSLHIPITMSFLPPSKRHPDSAKLAAKEPFYMVHLPLEAMHFSAEEALTLHVNDTQKVISRRIKKLKSLFPKVHYINNHTGSKFTASEIAMNRLIYALRKEGLMFIDSRTTAQTKVPKVMQNFHLPYIARDVFLDHVADVATIKKEIRRAVALAKRNGFAIAIGHPRKDTIEALRQSKELLKKVQLVTIDKLL